MVTNLKPGSTPSVSEPVKAAGAASHVRYRVLGLSFLMSFMMYMERGAMGAAAPTIMKEFHIDKITMGWSASAFNWSYALFQVPGGWMADRFGARLILAAAMAWWSVFTAATGFAFSAVSLATTRFLFGMGEAAGFPAGSRALLRWLPVRRRAFGQGFQHSGSRLGAALAPAIVVALIAVSGWRLIFYIFGAAGSIWACIWYAYYRNSPAEHKSVNAGELALLPAAPAKRQAGVKRAVPWRCILRSRDLWYLSFIYFCYGWVLWMYLQWFPTYLREARHFTQRGSALASIPLIAATITNIAGGLLSDRLATHWNDVRRGRMVVSMAGFTIAGLALLPGVLAADATTAMIYLTIALAGLELTVSVSWAVCLDIGGDFSGSVSSVMNMFGNLGGAASAVAIGYLATLFGWNSPFFLGSFVCLLSALLVTRVDPRRSAVGEVLASGTNRGT